jgi:tagaturonate reductase
MKQLSINALKNIEDQQGLSKPATQLLHLPEKVLQFGTGVLLRGLPDYYIDKANKQGIYNGRVVIVKSTSQGDTDAFKTQDGLYTQCIRGLVNGNKIEENIINASISRVLSAKDEWDKVLKCAANFNMELIVSNTTEVGISLLKEDKINAAPPVSFPGKLLSFLFKRYEVFKGDPTKGMVIVPTELIVDNGTQLRNIVLELAHLNEANHTFIDWLQNANHFCNSLVDRIVPGKLPEADKTAFKERYQFNDDLMIMSESYSLWAIEVKNDLIKEKLSFYKADKGVVIAPNINKFRELKLRLLNGTHTYTSGLAHLAGCATVKEAMDNEQLSKYVKQLMLEEIAPTITSNEITYVEATAFAESVMDRFRNPYIEHKWLSITMQYSSKMKMRNVPVLLRHYQENNDVPKLMALGFAAYILFMTCTQAEGEYTGTFNGETYTIQDDHAGWFADKCMQLDRSELVYAVLSDYAFWGADLHALPGFYNAVLQNIYLLEDKGAIETIIQVVNDKSLF